MKSNHPNIDIIAQVDRDNMAASVDVFHSDVVWHFFNPMVPEVAGSYHGLNGIAEFFEKVHSVGQGSFHIEPSGAWAIGEELVVVQTRNTLGDGDATLSFDVVVVWRIVEGRIKEVWDIPAIYTAQTGDAWAAS